VTWHEGEAVVHELEAGDGLLINSERFHNVAPVLSGVRHSLVTELWVAPDNQHDRFS
jgi:predicted 2-oxoglutarate/Fe(II)-dependent dioxygenase YbiX